MTTSGTVLHPIPCQIGSAKSLIRSTCPDLFTIGLRHLSSSSWIDTFVNIYFALCSSSLEMTRPLFRHDCKERLTVASEVVYLISTLKFVPNLIHGLRHHSPRIAKVQPRHFKQGSAGNSNVTASIRKTRFASSSALSDDCIAARRDRSDYMSMCDSYVVY